MYQISRLARNFGISRSTLLYYERIGLLSPSGRSESHYRLYSQADFERLELIRTYRQAGLTLEDIRVILYTDSDDTSQVLGNRLKSIGEEILALRAKQSLLAKMLKVRSGPQLPARVDKDTWIEMLRAVGMDDLSMRRWHEEFERRAPQAHHEFLLSLGVSEHETLLIREWSAGSTGSPSPTE